MINKDIQLCGIGNAIVDIQFEVDFDELEELELEKGTMSLVDDKIQRKTALKMGNRTRYKSSGGSAANTIIAFSSFGGKSAYKSMLGKDEDGRFYREEFINLGIVLDAEEDSEEHTGVCFVLITPDSERTMLTALGATVKHNKHHIKDEIIKRSEWLYIEGYKLSDEIGFEAVKHAANVAKKYDTKIAVTFSDKFIVTTFKDRLEEITEMSDLIFCNEVEGRAFTGDDSNKDSLNRLKKNYKNIAFTKSEKGSELIWDNENYIIPPYKTKAIDSTGAGDMYAGGFFYGLIHGGSIERAGHLGSLAASKIVSQHGARLKSSHTELRDKVFNKID